jgi:TRAP-type transport system periplasmic protein
MARGQKTLRATFMAATAAVAVMGTAQAQEMDMRLGSIFAPTVPAVECGALAFAEDARLKELGFDIDVIHSSQLGSEPQLAQQVGSGELEMSMVASSILAAWVEDLSVLESYYLYDDVDDAFASYNTKVARALFDELREVANIRVVGLPWLYGERHIFASRPIRTLDDLTGLKIRVPQTTVSIEGAQSLGASPTPVAYSEVYMALQQGIIDAAEAPISVIKAESFDEPATHISMTGHLITALPVIVNEQFWQSLSEEQRKALEQAVVDAAQRVRSCAEKADAEALASWKDGGALEVVEGVDVEAIKAASREYFSQNLPWSETYRNLLAELENK